MDGPPRRLNTSTTRRAQQQDIEPYVLVSGAWIVYAVFALIAPAGTTPRSNYRLPQGGLNAIRLSILLPLLVFWMMAVYGAQTFQKYAVLVTGSPEARPLRSISIALYLTLAYFIIGAVFGSVLTFYTHSIAYPALVLLRDHLAAAITVAAFVFFYLGSSRLCRVAGLPVFSRASMWTSAISALIAIGCTARFLTMHFTAAAVAGNSLAYAPTAVLVVTLFLPYFIAWYLGALSVVNITRYARKVHGVLYRRALSDLALGLCLVIGFSTLGGILDLVANTVAGLSLAPVLVILYLALLLYGAGYVFVARGARKLAMIETVDANA